MLVWVWHRYYFHFHVPPRASEFKFINLSNELCVVSYLLHAVADPGKVVATFYDLETLIL
jgi:hypothetical protein